MPSAQRALATLGEGAGGGRSILSWGRRGRSVPCGHARATRRRRGLDWIMSSSSREVMLHPNIIGKLEELAVLVAVSTGKPACLRWVQKSGLWGCSA